ncbi:hypothetical protein [Spirillospora sp. CA-128828]|uniref:hypothetical protein n=1 Tax=Spirillospora sp. CA-128828 TaxID=3240033 RepID=UPI003D937C35
MDKSTEETDAEFAPPGEPISTLTVLENYFGSTPRREDLHAMRSRDFDELARLVLSSSDAQVDTPVPPGSYYPGGWVAGNWRYQVARGDLNLLLLYYPRILVHDPVAEFFFRDMTKVPELRSIRSGNKSMTMSAGPREWMDGSTYSSLRDNTEMVREYLWEMIEAIFNMAPLIKKSVISMRSQWPIIVDRKHQVLTSMRHDVNSRRMQEFANQASASDDPLLIWDHLRGLKATPSDGVWKVDRRWENQYEFFYLAKTLALADSAGAKYVPSAESDLRLLQIKLESLGQANVGVRQPLSLLSEVARLLVPDFQLSAKTAVDMRQSEDSFDEWRRHLSRLARESREDGPTELRQRVEDEFVPVLNRIRNKTKRSKVMSSAIKEQSATAILTGTPAVAAPLLFGTGKPLVTLGVVTTGNVLQWMWKAYRPPSLGGTEAVMASIVRR